MGLGTARFDGISFVDALGIYRTIYGVPLKQRRELAHALTQLSERVQRSQLKTVAELYDYDTEFQAIADHCLKLNRIDPAWLNIDQLTQFLLAHKDAEGNACEPILQQLNFPPTPPPEKPATYEQAIAALSTHTKDIEQALRLAGYEQGELPSWPELEAILQARNEAMDPKAEEKQQEHAIAKSIEEVLESGSWFASFGAQVASPQQTDQLLSEILGG
ncbi:MAG TPA: hypothetical protein V6D19_11395 [Stenomitos sp.]